MKRPRPTLRRYSLAFAVVACLVFLLAAPYFVTGRHADLGLQGAAVFAASRDSYSLSSPVRLLEAPRVALESGTLSVPPTRTGLARGGEVIAMLITGSGASMTLEQATFTVDFSKNEANVSSSMLSGALAPLVATFQNLRFDSLAVRDSAIRLKLDDGAILLLDKLEAQVTTKPTGELRAAGFFVFRGETVAFDLTLGTQLDAQSGTRPIAASVTSDLLSASLEGHFMLGESPRLLSPQAELAIPSLRRAARWLGAGWPPGDGLDDFRVKGQLEWVNHTVAFQKASVQMDDNEADGTLSVNFAGARPAIDGTLGLKELDLSKYFGAAAPQGASLLSLVADAHGFEFPLIEAVEADLRLSSDSLVVPGVTIGRSAATISLKGGKMLADIAELEIDEGTRGGGQVRIDVNGAQPSYEIHGKLEALDLGRAGQAVFGHSTVQGRGDVTVDITGSGNNGAALLQSLGGKLSATVTEGGQLGIDVDQLVAAAQMPQAASVWPAASRAGVAIDSADLRFAVANGVLHAENAEAAAGSRAMKAVGSISLPLRLLDLQLAVGERPRPETATGSTPRQRTVVEVSGPWAQPSLQPAADLGPAPAPRLDTASPANPG
jgi:uncharacterized protein involved in outer membrane biogenesis